MWVLSRRNGHCLEGIWKWEVCWRWSHEYYNLWHNLNFLFENWIFLSFLCSTLCYTKAIFCHVTFINSIYNISFNLNLLICTNRAVILFLVYEVERNIYDHRLLETSVMKLEPRARLIRRSMPYLQKHLNSDDKRKLWVWVFCPDLYECFEYLTHVMHFINNALFWEI